MKVNPSPEKPSVLTVAPEIYKLLDPLERVALHQMAAEGRARILSDAPEVACPIR